ncbi:MAG: His-Xaa-Ser system protein HxsD [Chitinophagaceae bacterium]
MELSVFNDCLTIKLSQAQYEEAVVYKCFYWYSGKYQVTIKKEMENWNIRLESIDVSDEALQRLTEKVSRDLSDFKLRQIVTNETKVIRELLTAKAFAHHETDESPETNITDPVGFDPSQISQHAIRS